MRLKRATESWEMLHIGKINTLRVARESEIGFYLDGGDDLEILLPNRYVPRGLRVGLNIEVFVHTDSEDRLIATTDKPLAVAGDFVLLQVVSVGDYGAFLDWGLPKDLLLPFNQQRSPVREGDICLARVYLDESTGRLAASTKLGRFLNKTPPLYKPGEEVSLIIAEKTDLGYKAIINRKHTGLLFLTDVFEHLKDGEERTGYIKNVREDGKIDLTMNRPGHQQLPKLAEEILVMLKAQKGFLPVNDKTSPGKIRQLFSVSKNTFKMALGSLYKKRLITISDDGIRLAGKLAR